MLGLRRALLALFVVGVLFAGFDLALVLTSNHDDQKVVSGILGPLIGVSFIGTGAFAWWRRPLNRFGLLMTCVGFAWFLGGLTSPTTRWSSRSATTSGRCTSCSSSTCCSRSRRGGWRRPRHG